MRIRHRPWAMPELLESSFFIKEPKLQRGKWRELYPAEAPLYVESGCGKGGFVTEIALLHPEINFLAVDIKDDMLGLAKRKLERRFSEEQRAITNVRLTLMDIQRVEEILAPEDHVDRIYINFCNPWPRPKHKKRRLTHPRQLVQYQKFLKPDGELWFKTDDDELFEESLEYFKECGGSVIYLTRDLAQSGFSENVETEHEKMFTEMGKKIKFAVVVFGHPSKE